VDTQPKVIITYKVNTVADSLWRMLCLKCENYREMPCCRTKWIKCIKIIWLL